MTTQPNQRACPVCGQWAMAGICDGPWERLFCFPCKISWTLYHDDGEASEPSVSRATANKLRPTIAAKGRRR